MNLTEKEIALIENRERLVRIWPIAGSVMIVLVLGLAIWLFFFSPLLINPIHVTAEIEKGTIMRSSLVLMAGILPIMTLATLGLLLILILFAWVMIKREKKYLDIIAKGTKEEGSGTGDEG